SWGKNEEAKPLYKRSLAIDEKIYGSYHPEIATDLNNWARLLKTLPYTNALLLSQGKYAEAEPLYERSQTIQEKALGPEHHAVAVVLNNRAGLLQNQGKYTEAEPLYERSQAIREKALGPEHPAVAVVLNNRALLLKSQGKYEEVEPLYKRSLDIVEKTYGPDHPKIAIVLNNWAGLL
ncbi:unnamed protein product, partial [Ascophyllum nodosum]